VSVPVTVKVRAGWDYSEFAAPELAKRFEGVGAKMLTLHARFAKQGFEGKADWKLIGELRKALSIPLIGNGDVRAPEDAAKMFRETGCDGAMVGRVAISNPWAIQRIRAAFLGQPSPSEPSLEERIEVALRHLRLMVAYEAGLGTFAQAQALPPNEYADAELRACRHLRGQIPLYIKGAPGAAELRDKLTRCSRVSEYEELLNAFLSENQPLQ
jgi:tRNA-dihydrouridine synthase